MNTFINNLNDNMHRSKHGYLYNTYVRRFSSFVYGLGGRNLYEFLRLNFPGAFPSIPTLESYSNEYCTRIDESEFRFKELTDYSNKINCSFVYSFEDSTSVISKVQYDIESNSFIGFCVKLVNVLLLTRQYQTDDFTELENWFETVNQATLVTIHTVQPITSATSPSFLLSGFGTEYSFDTSSIVRRWLYVYEQCQSNNIRVVGVAGDADLKYLRAMRLATGYLEGESKLDYGLVLCDLFVKGEQNYSSCIKISSLNVLNMLEEN